ncbi:Tyrosine--tRNA ligase, mitochondrial [Nymphon striatum]|nr:Tyrosine--tRNA ligase, mitochondrial [Nymphon striatum]
MKIISLFTQTHLYFISVLFSSEIFALKTFFDVTPSVLNFWPNSVTVLFILFFIFFFRLYQRAHTIQKNSVRSYTNRNIFKLHERGILEDIFPESQLNISDLFSSPQCFYSGFDPTADSLHVGNLLVLIALIHCQRAGHQVLTVIGDGTAQIGDPSDKSKDREALPVKEIRENGKSIGNSIKRIFENHQKCFWKDNVDTSSLQSVMILHNSEWYDNLNVIQFLSSYGRQLRMGSMLSRKSVSKRLNSEFGMNFSEFSYQILQAYDWFHLLNNHKCRFQIGGSDQMGNIHSGYELIHNLVKDKVYGVYQLFIVCFY